MPIHVSCDRCGQASAAPDHLAGQQARCAGCGSTLTIPASNDSQDPEPQEYGVQLLPEERWQITLPDGRQIGPATLAQFEAAAARGAIPPSAYVRRGDWEHAIPFSSYVAQRQAEAHAAAQQAEAARKAAANPYGTGMQQLASNPVGTLLFGPKMPKYRASRDPSVREQRRRVFLRWVYGLLGLTGAAILLPLLGGLLRLDPILGISGSLMGLFLSFWPGVFYLIGMFPFAGALFEWSLFMNSRRMRAMRSGGGDAMARGFWIWFGGITMGLSGAASAVLTLCVAGAMFFVDTDPTDDPPEAIAQNPATPENFQESGEWKRKRPQASTTPASTTPEIVVQAEAKLRNRRAQLDGDLQSLEEALVRHRRLEQVLEINPRDPSAQFQRQTSVDGLRRYRENLATSRRNWSEALAALEAALRASGMAHSDTLNHQRRQPPPGDPPLHPAEEGNPETSSLATVEQLEADIEKGRMELRGLMNFCDQNGLDRPAVIDPGPPVRTGTAREHLRFLAEKNDALRVKLTAIEQREGYRSRLLDERTFQAWVEKYLADRAIVLDEPATPPAANRPPPFPVSRQARIAEYAGKKVVEVTQRQQEAYDRLSKAREERQRLAFASATDEQRQAADKKFRQVEIEIEELRALLTYWTSVPFHPAGAE
jgi:hypothetical protein